MTTAQSGTEEMLQLTDAIQLSVKQGEPVPHTLQQRALASMLQQFRENLNQKNQGTLTGTALQNYLECCKYCLQHISNDLLTIDPSVPESRRLAYGYWSAFMGLKYQNTDAWRLDDQKQRIFSEDPAVVEDTGFLPVANLELMERVLVNGTKTWRFDFSISAIILERFELQIKMNGRKTDFEVTKRYGETRVFGKCLVRRTPFYVLIPESELTRDNQLVIELTDGSQRIQLELTSGAYQSRLVKQLEHSYWCAGGFAAQFVRGRSERSSHQGAVNGISIRRIGRWGRIGREFAFLKEILMAPYGSKRMFGVRCLYWLTRPFYRGKRIWITFDKLYKGGDCGEYFYKYLCSRKNEGITPVYVIRKDVADYERLCREGYHPSTYYSMRQRLEYLNSSMVFATHSSVHGFCGFTKWEIRFVQDRLHTVNTCIQHGLSVQNLTHDSNRIINNNKRYYCASKYEIENLSKPEYDYDKEVFRLTGIPRYDGLVDRDQHQILITPTWRSYIAMPPVLGSARPYNPDFKETDYYKIFQGLLQNAKLSQAAEGAGYRVIFLLHPVISSQKEDFHPGKGIELVSALDVNYEKILTESSLMVTDYSGVQFDFAYMRKPVVYFHPPELPPHYEEGGFFYETQGFGEICTNTEQLVDTLCEYLSTKCRRKEAYRKREDDFFAFDDQESCRRIYEDAVKI